MIVSKKIILLFPKYKEPTTMTEQYFQLKENQSFISLNKLLQILGFAQTGGHAKIIIKNDEVSVNGIIETQIRKKLIKSDKIIINDCLIQIK